MALTTPMRERVRSILGRDRLEIVEQAARQATTLCRLQAERLEALEQRVAALAAEAAKVQARVDQLEETLVAADPAMTRHIVTAVRDDVRRLVIEVNQVLDDRVATA